MHPGVLESSGPSHCQCHPVLPFPCVVHRDRRQRDCPFIAHRRQMGIRHILDRQRLTLASCLSLPLADRVTLPAMRSQPSLMPGSGMTEGHARPTTQNTTNVVDVSYHGSA